MGTAWPCRSMIHAGWGRHHDATAFAPRRLPLAPRRPRSATRRHPRATATFSRNGRRAGARVARKRGAGPRWPRSPPGARPWKLPGPRGPLRRLVLALQLLVHLDRAVVLLARLD